MNVDKLLTKFFQKENVVIECDTDKYTLVLDRKTKITPQTMPYMAWYNALSKKMNCNDPKVVLNAIMDYCIKNNITFSSKEEKEAEALRKKEEKEAEALRKKEEKEAEALRKKEEKEAEALRKKEEKEAALSKVKQFEEEFDYNKFNIQDIPTAVIKQLLHREMEDNCGIVDDTILKRMYAKVQMARTINKKEAKQAAIDEKTKSYSDFGDMEFEFEKDKDGIIKASKPNVHKFMIHHPSVNGGETLRYNEFAQTETYKGQIIEDEHIGKIDLEMSMVLGFSNETYVKSLSKVICHDNSYNPIMEGFEKLRAKYTWDGEERLKKLFTLVGAPDNEYTHELTMKWFYALMKRLYQPGCVFDHMLILHDEAKGTGKSKIIPSLLEALDLSMEDNPFHIFQEATTINKDVVHALITTWVGVFDEMGNFLKEASEDTKSFLTTSIDSARLSYGHTTKNYPRHCVFIGNTNLREFMKDNTNEGRERRFWIIDCHGEKHEDSYWWDKHFDINTKRQMLLELYDFYHNNPNYKYNVLEDDTQDMCYDIQRGHWTSACDSALKFRILTAVLLPVNFETHNTYYKWQKSVQNDIDTLNSTGNLVRDNYLLDVIRWGKAHENDTFCGENSIKTALLTPKSCAENPVFNGFSHKIPVDWVCNYAALVLRRQITPNYVTKILSGIFKRVVKKEPTLQYETDWYECSDIKVLITERDRVFGGRIGEMEDFI